MTQNKVVTDKCTGVATDRVILGYRIRTIQQCREILYLRQKALDPAKCCQLWKKVMSSQGFSPSFAEWLLISDIVDHVPFECPQAPWFQHVVQVLDAELQLWSQAESRQKRVRVAQSRQCDWASGGRLHAMAVKPPSLGTLESLTKSTRRRFRLQRSVKGSMAKVKVFDQEDTPVGVVWNFNGNGPQAKVIAVEGPYVIPMCL